jgi:hypothetical protein
MIGERMVVQQPLFYSLSIDGHDLDLPCRSSPSPRLFVAAESRTGI